MGPTINGREVECIPKPPWKLLQDRHFRLRLCHGAPCRHIVPKCVNIVRLTIAKAFLKGDARVPGSRVNVDVSKILLVSCLKTY